MAVAEWGMEEVEVAEGRLGPAMALEGRVEDFMVGRVG